MLHMARLDQTVHVQAHGAIGGAGQAVGAASRVCFEAQGGPGQGVAQLAAQDHEGRHPADGVTAGAPPHKDRQGNKESNHHVVNDIGE